MSEPPLAGQVLEIAIALVVRDGLLLVTKRTAGSHLSGYWEFPGGKVHPGETPEDAAVREVNEETGVVVRAKSRRTAIDWTYPERRVRLQPIDCTWVNGDGEPREVAELRWVSFDELSTLTFPDANAALIAELVASRPPT